MATEPKIKRISVKYKHPNPLFEKWIKEWLEQAKVKNSKLQQVFSNALSTLKKYPLPLDSGRDCIILKGFGKKLCDMLDKKLAEHRITHDNISDKTVSQNKSFEIYDNIENNTQQISPVTSPSGSNIGTAVVYNKNNEIPVIIEQRNTRSSNHIKTYKPAKRSGAYAILLTLLKTSQKTNSVGYMTKIEIIEQAKDFCDKSFVKPDLASYYTAWSSMTTLIKKELVSRTGNPAKFCLTEKGIIVASQFVENNETVPLSKNTENNNVLPRNDFNELPHIPESNLNNSSESSKNCKSPSDIRTTPESAPLSETDTVIFSPFTFDIILLVDTQETAGSSQSSQDETISELNKLNVHFEVRHLKVGDFTWVCRERNSKHELILPYIVERKRIDDLGHSIKDGRFHEQKFRLKLCGLQNLIYIVENYKCNTHAGLPLSSLMQATANTLIQDQFQVKFTQNHRHSMQYLSGFTKMLRTIYEKKTVVSCCKEDLVKSCISDDLISLMSFNDFNKGASKIKNFKIREIFARQLLQLKGVSVDKALAIIDKYSTPRLLKNEYDKVGNHGEKLLANIQYGPLKRSIGPAISTSIYQLYNSEKLT